ncbi:type II secretion system F family protein [soil metagenome]
MKLNYKAAKQDGKIVTGLIEAKDAKEAAIYLRSQQLFPIAVSSEDAKTIQDYLPFHKKFGFKDLVFFTRQLSSMLVSGLTLMQALSILRNQVQNPAMQIVLEGVIADVQEGQTLSQAIAKYPDIFTPTFVSLIRAGEASGLLDKILLRLADNLEKQQKLQATIKGALTYPIIVIVLMFAVVSVLMIFVIPQLTSLYTSMNIELPLSTKIVVGISNLFTKYWYIMIGVAVGSYLYYRKWYQSETGRVLFDTLILKAPVFGKLLTQSNMAEFTRTFGLLVGTGTLVVESLTRSADTIGNVVYKKAILAVSKRVEKGISIGDALSAGALFPSIVVEMVKIGEQTGKLDESLTKLSEYYEREVEQTVKALTTALEPFIMIVLAVGVGFLIISIITPIYSLVPSIQ